MERGILVFIVHISIDTTLPKELCTAQTSYCSLTTIKYDTQEFISIHYSLERLLKVSRFIWAIAVILRRGSRVVLTR
jgi:hypothetical protein